MPVLVLPAVPPPPARSSDVLRTFVTLSGPFSASSPRSFLFSFFSLVCSFPLALRFLLFAFFLAFSSRKCFPRLELPWYARTCVTRAPYLEKPLSLACFDLHPRTGHLWVIAPSFRRPPALAELSPSPREETTLRGCWVLDGDTSVCLCRLSRSSLACCG